MSTAGGAVGHELPGSEGTYSHTTLPMELRIAEVLQGLWEQSQKAPADPAEYGPVPEPEAPRKMISQISPKRSF